RLVALPRGDQERVTQPRDGCPPEWLLEKETAHVRKRRAGNLAQRADCQATIEIATYTPGACEDRLQRASRDIRPRVRTPTDQQRHTGKRTDIAGIKDHDPLGVIGRDALKDGVDQVRLRVDHDPAVASFD